MRLRTSRTDFHRHFFEVSPVGDGLTTLDMGHRHDIKGFKVQNESEHSHVLLGIERVFANQIQGRSFESSEMIKGTTSSAVVQEKSTNVPGDIPVSRTYGEHRRLEAVKRVNAWFQTKNRQTENESVNEAVFKVGDSVEAMLNTFRKKEGKPIKGKIIRIDNDGVYGDIVFVKHDDGRIIQYYSDAGELVKIKNESVNEATFKVGDPVDVDCDARRAENKTTKGNVRYVKDSFITIEHDDGDVETYRVGNVKMQESVNEATVKLPQSWNISLSSKDNDLAGCFAVVKDADEAIETASIVGFDGNKDDYLQFVEAQVTDGNEGGQGIWGLTDKGWVFIALVESGDIGLDAFEAFKEEPLSTPNFKVAMNNHLKDLFDANFGDGSGDGSGDGEDNFESTSEVLRQKAISRIKEGYGIPHPRFAGGDKRKQEVEDIVTDTEDKKKGRMGSGYEPVAAKIA